MAFGEGDPVQRGVGVMPSASPSTPPPANCRSPSPSARWGGRLAVQPVELVDGDPAEDVVGDVKAGQDRGGDARTEGDLAETEAVRGAFGVAGGSLRPLLLRGAHAEGQDEEQGQGPEQDV